MQCILGPVNRLLAVALKPCFFKGFYPACVRFKQYIGECII